MELISVEELINILKQNNINLGKGDPYNRLRYYTKIGLIPHMIRKKNSNNTNSGHFPREVIEKIIQIEKLKSEGLSNDLISKKIKEKNKVEFFSNSIERIKKFGINFLFILLIILGLIYEVYRMNSHQEKSSNQLITESQNLNWQKISQNGVSFIPSGQKKVFVPVIDVTQKSTILLSFRGSLFPATNYYISEIKDGVGFYVETNLEVFKEVKFNWIIIN